MTELPPTLPEFLARTPAPAALQTALLSVAQACTDIAAAVARGPLGPAGGAPGTVNASGETQQALDLLAERCFQARAGACGAVAGLASEEMEAPLATAGGGDYLLVYDPLDGSSNIAVNVSVGSIFSLLPAPGGRAPEAADYLQAGTAQQAAGFCVYGPATVLVLTVGQGTHAFTLDAARGDFAYSGALTIPAATKEFSINASNQRFWEPPVQRYIAECLAGADGPRGKDFNMRWVASMVADVYRILIRGGVFLYPRDRKDPTKPGKLRLMYEAAPMALVVEQAGGSATDGVRRMLEIQPQKIHQRVAVVLGSRQEVERVRDYHAV